MPHPTWAYDWHVRVRVSIGDLRGEHGCLNFGVKPNTLRLTVWGRSWKIIGQGGGLHDPCNISDYNHSFARVLWWITNYLDWPRCNNSMGRGLLTEIVRRPEF